MELAEKYVQANQLDLQDLSLKDLGVSAFTGANSDTGALGMFINMVKNKEIASGSYVLVESFDRLSRQSVEVALGQFLEIINLGIVIVTLSDQQVFQSGSLDMTKLIISITVMSRANEESQMKSSRAKAVWNQRREEARVNGKFITNSNYPRWLQREGDGLELSEGNAKIINLIFKWSIEGFGYQKISEMLNNKGHFTFHKKKP